MTRRKLAVLLFAVMSATTFAAPDKTRLALGDTNADLVYTPLPALCRIIDTRSGAPLNSTPRSFYVAGSTHDFASQGGTAGGCGVPDGATAVLINFVAVNPAGGGNLRGAAYPLPIPTTGSLINYQALSPALNIANGIPFPICDPASATCDYDIRLLANGATTHLVADVAGYFRRFPKLTLIAGEGLSSDGNSGEVTLSLDFGSSGAATTASRSDHKHSLQVVIVTPVGDESANGDALISALAAILDASASKPYLLKIDAGIYDFGGTSLVAKPYVHLEGSGELRTILRRRPGNTNFDAVIVAASNSNIRMLTAETTGSGGSIGAGIYANGAITTISNVTARAINGTFANSGIFCGSAANVTLKSVTAIATGGSSEAAGLYASGVSVMVTASELTATGSGASTSSGVRNFGGATVNLFNSRVTGSGGGSLSAGVFSTSSSATLRRVRAEAIGSPAYGIINVGSGPMTVRIDESEVIGASATILNQNGNTYVGASRLAGGNVSVTGGTSLTCVESYDENYAGSFGACP